ncbi:MAG: hypothetical protein ACI4TK_08385 [Agathobacter sp.]
MWVKVIKKFRDKNTKKVYKVGEKLNLKKERIDEILSVDEFIEEIKEKDTDNENTGEEIQNKEEASE